MTRITVNPVTGEENVKCGSVLWQVRPQSVAARFSLLLVPASRPSGPLYRTCGCSKDGVMRPTKVSAEYGVSLAKGKTSVAGAAA